jgi:Protein of unknown function (DUF2628)
MMAVYTVHEPPRRHDDTLAHTARFVFVRDGFHWSVFLLAPLWMLRHRMWLELIVYLLLIAGVSFALRRLGIDAGAGLAVGVLISLLVGIEASSLRRWKLSRRGFVNLGVVVGEDLEDAERRFFDGWVRTAPEPEPVPPAAPSPFGPPSSSSTEIVGLFPQPEPRP